MNRFLAILTPIIAVALAAVVAPAVSADEVPWNTYIVDRTVEVSPGARKNKAFPMEEGSALCDLHLRAEAPWRIRYSCIALRDDKTLWFKASDREYIIASGYAPNEYVVVRGELEKSGGGSGKGAEERPQFQVTVPKVDLQWAAKHGEASQEEKEDSVPAVIMVSESPEDFGTLVVSAPKDDFQLSNPRVTLTWAPANAVKVYKGNSEVGSGVSWLLMAGTQLELSVKAVRAEVDVKFTLKGEPDVVSHERAVDYARAMCAKVEFVTPAGDPVRAPKDVGDGQNEFTFSDANPGVLTINLKARVTPVAAAALMVNDCRFGVEAVGNSKMEWSKDNKGGKAAFVVGFLTATVKFIGLPEKNDAFGKKIAMLLWNGRKCDEENYEVFFPKIAKNHPGGQAGSPNWFYYWGQTSANKGNTTIKYLNATRSYYDYASDRTIFIANDAALSQISIWGTPKGIDCYAWTTAHEAKHHRQFTNFWPTQWRAVDDTDMDWLPNDQEPIYMPGRPYSPTNPATYPDVFGYGQNPIRDCEDINMRSQNPPYSLDKLWENGSANLKDWANPGKQSRQTY